MPPRVRPCLASGTGTCGNSPASGALDPAQGETADRLPLLRRVQLGQARPLGVRKQRQQPCHVPRPAGAVDEGRPHRSSARNQHAPPPADCCESGSYMIGCPSNRSGVDSSAARSRQAGSGTATEPSEGSFGWQRTALSRTVSLPGRRPRATTAIHLRLGPDSQPDQPAMCVASVAAMPTPGIWAESSRKRRRCSSKSATRDRPPTDSSPRVTHDRAAICRARRHGSRFGPRLVPRKLITYHPKPVGSYNPHRRPEQP